MQTAGSRSIEPRIACLLRGSKIPIFAGGGTCPSFLVRPFASLAFVTSPQKTHTRATEFSEMAFLHIHSPSDALSCMSEELKLQLEDSLWREKQEEAMVCSNVYSCIRLIQLYAPGNADLPLLRSKPAWLARALPPFRAGTHPLRPTREEDIPLLRSICANRVRHVLRSPIISPPCAIRLEESASGQVFGCLRTLWTDTRPFGTTAALA
jgi:hypothetical protein